MTIRFLLSIFLIFAFSGAAHSHERAVSLDLRNPDRDKESALKEYMTRLRTQIELNWHPSKLSTPGNVEAHIVIARDGSLLRNEITSNDSNDDTLAKSVLKAITRASPAVPPWVKPDVLIIRATFRSEAIPETAMLENQASKTYTPLVRNEQNNLMTPQSNQLDAARLNLPNVPFQPPHYRTQSAQDPSYTYSSGDSLSSVQPPKVFYQPQTPEPVKVNPISKSLMSTSEIAKRALASTMLIIVVSDDRVLDPNNTDCCLGSGFIVAPAVIATNYHVVEDSKKYQAGSVRYVNTQRFWSINRILAVDKTSDLALIYVPEILSPILPLGNSDSVSIGDTLFVAGNPKNLEGTFTQGIVSGLHRLSSNKIQMDAAISSGSSGGPVLNEKGEVVGISVSSRVGGENLNFAVPVNDLKKLMALFKLN